MKSKSEREARRARPSSTTTPAALITATRPRMAPNKLGRTRGPQTNSRDVFAAARLRAQASASTPPAATPLTSGGSQLRAATSDAGRSGAVLATATAAGKELPFQSLQDVSYGRTPMHRPGRGFDCSTRRASR